MRNTGKIGKLNGHLTVVNIVINIDSLNMLVRRDDPALKNLQFMKQEKLRMSLVYCPVFIHHKVKVIGQLTV